MKRQFVWYHSTVQKELRTRLRTKIRKADIYIDLYIYIYTYGGLIPKNRVVWLCRWSCFFFFFGIQSHTGGEWELAAGGRPSRSEGGHAVQVEVVPRQAAAAVFFLVHLGAVAVLVRALRRLVGVMVTDLLVLLLLFNAGLIKKEKNTHNQDVWLHNCILNHNLVKGPVQTWC